MNKLEAIRAKIHTIDTLKRQIAQWRFLGDTVVFTNGCFDIIHKGHIDYLCKAADLGKRLIVALNSDESVKMLGKGNSRPLQDQGTRELIMASFHFVDGVVLFTEETPYELIKELQPDILVKGGDWKEKDIVGGDIVKAKGGKVLSIPFLEGYSTTAIENKIKNSK
jgi:D-glycero-beta-D-manno-heptose 1-phosphate adenylyltransferase